MFSHLQKKFLILYALILVSSFALLYLYTFRVTEEHMLLKKKELLQREALILTNQYISSYQTGTMSHVNIDYLINSLDQYINARIWFVDSEGVIIADSRQQIRPTDFNLKDFDEALLYQPFYMVGNFYDYFDRPMITVGSPVIMQNTLRGTFVFHTDMKIIEDELSFHQRLSALTVLLTTFIAFLLTQILTRNIVNPLKAMNKAASKYANGEFESTIQVKSNDEIGQLATSLNNMAYELSNLEEFRRSFIANISHDFKSPLTSIKGYVGAIADGTIPYEQQEKYLTIVLDETDRLNKLTSDILLLTTMENQGLNLQSIPFDIHTVIRKVVSTFEQKCVEKNINVDLMLANEQLIVYADIDRIQQVLYNLFDNAVKFSYLNGTITIETTEKNNTVYVSVKDIGMGIPKENLKYIWDRFYKNDRSRGVDKKGTGLGLSIVKEILKAHNETIRVHSTKGIGTEFVFSLTKP